MHKEQLIDRSKEPNQRQTIHLPIASLIISVTAPEPRLGKSES